MGILKTGPWNPGQVDARGGGGDDGGMEARVAKLEAGVEFVQRELSDVKTDIREVRAELRGIRHDMVSDFRALFGALIVAALGLAGLMAKGFGWL